MGGYSGLLRGYLGLSGRFLGVFVKGCVVAVRKGKWLYGVGLDGILRFCSPSLVRMGKACSLRERAGEQLTVEQEREEKKEKKYFSPRRARRTRRRKRRKRRIFL